MDAFSHKTPKESLQGAGIIVQNIAIFANFRALGEMDRESSAEAGDQQGYGSLVWRSGGCPASAAVPMSFARLRAAPPSRLISSRVACAPARERGLPLKVPPKATPPAKRLFHDLASSSDNAERHAPAHCLAERRHIRRHTIKALRATRSDAEAGDDLVQQQQRTMLCANLTNLRQIPVLRKNAAAVAKHWFHDDPGNAARMLRQKPLQPTRYRSRA